MLSVKGAYVFKNISAGSKVYARFSFRPIKLEHFDTCQVRVWSVFSVIPPAGEADLLPGNVPCRGHAAGQSGRGCGRRGWRLLPRVHQHVRGVSLPGGWCVCYVCLCKHLYSQWKCERQPHFSPCMAASHYVTPSFSPCVYAADSALGNVLQSAAAEPHWERRRPHHVGQTWRTDDPYGRHAQITLQKEKVCWHVESVNVCQCAGVIVSSASSLKKKKKTT